MESIVKVLGLFLIFGSVLFLAYVTTRYIGTRSRKAGQGKYISIIDTVSLGMDKQLHLVRVDKQFVLIATTGKSVELLTKLNIENFDFDAAEEENTGGIEFVGFLEKYARVYKDKLSRKDTSVAGDDESALNKDAYLIKRNLEKLKSLNSKAYINDGKDGNDFTNEK
ncbi:hypothetical protein CDQ84_05265 [Clostridium thermosuccinogenes]|jgi:flagellar protein FliO/FliZ|uniref:Flagellar protein n=1 Tax=Clostridium thermosuccinogenes TaxID=84032 RepID=A0A2K2F2H3_9CLOT|nr:flagellar biosynthetic protein FliO [Pseudoclostridium thermosuccinogenes]AUS96338.1 hypothetical protein CDO33_07765 [Pseudoclostridium thermosuccinogenes]PNT92988.1 hypothetical protein CDQ83_05430 [Pseudoclostridium thermosuccinogenes]PNT98552.1 hypothetical protein CDQ85_05170 [Pseudoclostridium thermosuccinogenes]PNU00654.1 hypothetical protein CDQ84_05265 [Pseudoclostridium thermosuccinogenes]